MVSAWLARRAYTMNHMSKFWSLFRREEQPASRRPAGETAKDVPAPGGLEDKVVAIIRRECPAFSPADMYMRFDRLGIDSVGMLMIHTAVEEATGRALENRQWVDILTPAALVDALRAAGGEP
jgi:acyl carrier protein